MPSARHRLDRRQRLVEREDPVVERLLAAEPRGQVARLLHAQLEAAREVALALASSSAGTGSSRMRASSSRIAAIAGRQLVRVHAGRDLERAGVGVVDDAGARRRRPGPSPRGR